MKPTFEQLHQLAERHRRKVAAAIAGNMLVGALVAGVESADQPVRPECSATIPCTDAAYTTRAFFAPTMVFDAQRRIPYILKAPATPVPVRSYVAPPRPPATNRKALPARPPAANPALHRPLAAAQATLSFEGLHGLQGGDVSFPQCKYPALPARVAIAIVGLNDGIPGRTNRCLTGEGGQPNELAWAVARAPQHIEVYVNANNPGKAGSDLWPAGDTDARGQHVRSKYGQCHGEDSAACAYLRGRDLAQLDIDRRLRPAAAATGAVVRRLWLDVEGSPWQNGVKGQAANVATLEGMTESFMQDGYQVGVYAPPSPWAEITGGRVGSSSSLYALAEWRPQGYGYEGAVAACRATPLTPGGKIIMTQYVSGQGYQEFDYDYICPGT